MHFSKVIEGQGIPGGGGGGGFPLCISDPTLLTPPEELYQTLVGLNSIFKVLTNPD